MIGFLLMKIGWKINDHEAYGKQVRRQIQEGQEPVQAFEQGSCEETIASGRIFQEETRLTSIYDALDNIRKRFDEGVDVQRSRLGNYQFKFGYNGDIGTTEETIWDEGGKYGYPASASLLTVSSNSPTDSLSASGARTVDIFGLDSSYDSASETISLDGLSGVPTTKSYLRLNRMIVRTAGGNGENSGLIYAGSGSVTSGVPTTKLARISATENQTLMCTWTVPNGKRCYIRKIGVSSFGNQNAFLTVRFRVRPFGEVFQTKNKFLVTRALNEPKTETPVKFGPKTDMEIAAQASAGTLDASAFIDMTVLDDD